MDVYAFIGENNDFRIGKDFFQIAIASMFIEWIFQPSDDVAISSQVEATFRVITHDLFSMKKRVNVDIWLEIHSNHLTKIHELIDKKLPNEPVRRMRCTYWTHMFQSTRCIRYAYEVLYTCRYT